MASILQCLSNTEPLVRYFLLEVYKFHLNKNNKFGTQGRLATCFYDLIYDLYAGKRGAVRPD